MLPKHHVLIGLIASLMLNIILNLTYTQTLVIFLASFLIDIDHYLAYVFAKKDFSLKNAKEYYSKRRLKWIATPLNEKKKYKRTLFIFHGIEFWCSLVIIAFYINIFWFVLLGFLIHMILDYIEMIFIKDSLSAKFSQGYVHYTNKRKIEFN